MTVTAATRHAAGTNGPRTPGTAGQRGFVVMAVLAFVLLGAALALLLVEESGMGTITVAGQAERRTLDYVTEAGISHALWRLRQNTTCSNYTQLPSTPFAGHSYAVSVTPTAGSPVALVATGTLAGGAAGNRVRAAVQSYAEPATLVLQPGTEGKDSFIEADAGHQDHNKGNDPGIEVDSEAGKELRGLLQFDLAAIPFASRITNASLRLVVQQSQGAADTLNVHRLRAGWVEDEVTWLDRTIDDAWASPGGDFDPTVAGQFEVSLSGPVAVDITDLVQDWVSGKYPNHGLLLLAPSSPGGQKKEFPSSDISGVGVQPELTVTYACECGVPCAVGNVALLAHWKLDETSGNIAVDSVGDHDGSLAGNPTWSTGRLDGALDFDGTDDLVDVGGILRSGTPELTISAWVFKRDGADSRVITKSSSTSRQDHVYSLGVSNRIIRVRLKTADHDGNADFDGGNISLNQWTHLAFTYDGSALRIYRNGAETAVHALTGDIVASNLDTIIGNVNTSDARYWNGLLDDVRLYDAALSDAEIAELAGRGPTELVAHWTLDDGAGSTATDATGNHDGTLQGGPSWTSSGLDGSLLLDGNNDYIDAGSFDVLGTGITMSAWMNANELRNDGRIVSKATSINARDAWWQLSISDIGADHFLRMRIKAGGSTTSQNQNSAPLLEDHWHFVAGSYDNASGEMRLYLNGTEVDAQSHGVGGALDGDPAVPVWVGGNGDPTRFFDGTLDDVRIYNGALTPGEISDLEDSGADAHTPAYTEARADLQTTTGNAWETVDLTVFGVPPDAVAEIAIVNTSDNRQRFGGVRSAGSSLDRRLQLHEAEGAGNDVVSMLVQVGGSGNIELFADAPNDVDFRLLGYWETGSYIERIDIFASGTNSAWSSYSLATHSVPPGSVTDLAILNLSQNTEFTAGARSRGSTAARLFELHEAEGGGRDMLTVTTRASSDASSAIEIFADATGAIDFYLLGYWSVPPGEFTEAFLQVPGSPGSSGAWESLNLQSLGVPGYSIVELALANGEQSAQAVLGARRYRSTLDRQLTLHEAEGGGDDFGVLQVKTDGDARIEWFDSDISNDHRAYVLGWWILPP